MTSTPLALERNDCDSKEETILKRIECRRLLLNAGADPTIKSPDRDTAIEHAVNCGTVVNISSPHNISILLIIL
jgi:hypothetical protein